MDSQARGGAWTLCYLSTETVDGLGQFTEEVERLSCHETGKTRFLFYYSQRGVLRDFERGMLLLRLEFWSSTLSNVRGTVKDTHHSNPLLFVFLLFSVDNRIQETLHALLPLTRTSKYRSQIVRFIGARSPGEDYYHSYANIARLHRLLSSREYRLS